MVDFRPGEGPGTEGGEIMDLERHLRMTNEMYRFLFETDAKTAHIPKIQVKTKRISIQVPVPGEEIPVTIVMQQCRECAGITGIEDGRKAFCPYCRGELMVMEG
jgi:hypothetical protein